MVRRFNLKPLQFDGRDGGKGVLAWLTVQEDGKITLDHNLSTDQLEMLPQVLPVDEENRYLKIQEGVDVAFYDSGGTEQLSLHNDDFEFLDVIDPKGMARLRTFLTGPGSAVDRPVSEGELVLQLVPFQKVHVFISRVLQLYSKVDTWLQGTSLKTVRSSRTITEDIYGSYGLPALEVQGSGGRLVATLMPIGASVIGAEGRVDIVGSRDRQVLLYFAPGGPQINVTVGTGSSATKVSHPVFKDVTGPGWYWIEDVRLGRARQLDEALFRDLLKTVADLYEF